MRTIHPFLQATVSESHTLGSLAAFALASPFSTLPHPLLMQGRMGVRVALGKLVEVLVEIILALGRGSTRPSFRRRGNTRPSFRRRGSTRPSFRRRGSTR